MAHDPGVLRAVSEKTNGTLFPPGVGKIPEDDNSSQILWGKLPIIRKGWLFAIPLGIAHT